jgi:TP901 family phage tail tape measure protein
MSIQNLTAAINLQIAGTRQASNQIRGVTTAIENLTKSFNRSSQSQTKHQKQTKTSQQGLANIQAGLVQLSTWLLNTNVRINNLFDNMTKRFIESETAMTQLRVTMGLAGESATDPMFRARFQEFDMFKNRIDDLAMTTEFTKKQVANAFTALVQSGRTGAEAMKMLNGTLQLATASGGQLDLGQAVDIATLTLGTLGGSVEEVDDNLNMLLKTSQKTKIGFRDLQQVLGSLRASYSRFAETTGVSREAELMGLAAATRGMGLGGAESAQQVDQFSRSILGLVGVVSKGQLRQLKGMKVEGRFSMKRESLLQFFGVQSMSKSQIQKRLGQQFSNVSVARDAFVKNQLMNFDKKTGKFEQKSISQLMETLVSRYAVLKEAQGAEADAIAKQAFGTQSAQFMLQAIVKLAEQSGKKVGDAGKVFQELVATISKNNGELAKSQAEALKTLEKRIELVNSAEDALSNTIFQHDIYANAILDTYKETLTATNKLMKNNDSLASSISFIGRMMQFLTGVGTTLGFTLTAMATFSIALTHSLKNTKGAATGFGATMRAFGSMFLVPTLTVMMQMIGALGILGISVVALMRYFSGAEGIGEGFKIVLEKIGDVARATGGIIQLAFSSLSGKKSLEELTNDFYRFRDQKRKIDQEILAHEMGTAKLSQSQFYLKKRQSRDFFDHLQRINKELGAEGRRSLVKMELEGSKETVSTIARITDHIKNLAKGIAVIGESAIQPIMLTLGAVFDTLYYTLDLLLMPVRAIATLFGFVSDEGSFMTSVLKGIGTVLGVIISGFLLSGAWKMFAMTLMGLKNKFISLGQGVHSFVKSQQAMQKITSQTINVNKVNISYLDRLKLKYYELTGQTQKYQQTLVQAGVAAKKHGKTQMQMINGFQGVGMAIASLGGMMTMFGEITGNELASSTGNMTMLFGTILAFVPQLVNGFQMIIQGVRLLTLANIKSAIVMAAAWWPLYTALYAIYLLYSAFSKVKPKPLDLTTPLTTQPTASMTGTNLVTASPLGGGGTYLRPYIGTGATAQPMVRPPSAMATTYMPSTPVNDNSTTIHIKNQTVVANDPKRLAEKTKRQSGKGLNYNTAGTGR